MLICNFNLFPFPSFPFPPESILLNFLHPPKNRWQAPNLLLSTWPNLQLSCITYLNTDLCLSLPARSVDAYGLGGLQAHFLQQVFVSLILLILSEWCTPVLVTLSNKCEIWGLMCLTKSLFLLHFDYFYCSHKLLLQLCHNFAWNLPRIVKWVTSFFVLLLILIHFWKCFYR